MLWTRKVLCAALAFLTSSLVLSAISGTAAAASLPAHPGLTSVAVVASMPLSINGTAAA